MFIPGLCALLASMPTLAQLAPAAAASSAQPLPVQVVTATSTTPRPFDLPASVNVVDLTAPGRDARHIGPLQALHGIPGLLVRDRQNLAQDSPVSIRGFGARAAFGIRGVRLLVDGIPASSPDGQGQLSHVMFGAAERIEVLRGPFAALYANAAGGLIRIDTAEGAPPAQQRFDLGSGSNGVAHAEFGASGGNGWLGYRLDIDRSHVDGGRAHARADRRGGNLRVDWQCTPQQQLTLVANVFDQPQAQDPQSLTRAQYDADPQQAAPSALAYDTRKRVRQSQLGLVLHQWFDDGQSLRVSTYAGHRAVTQFLSVPVFVQASPLSSGGVIDLGDRFDGADLRWQWLGHAFARPLTLTAGLGDEYEDTHRRGYDNFVGGQLGVRGTLRRDEHDISESRGMYALGTLRLAPHWDLSAGLRHSDVRIQVHDGFVSADNPDDSGRVTYTATTPVLGLLFRVTRRWHLYAAWGRAFETPTVAELGYRADGSAGLNLALQPARTVQAELGTKWRGHGGSRIDIAVFGANTGDTLGVASSSGGRTTYRNIGHSRRRGVELSAHWPFARHWTLSLAATDLAAHVIAADGHSSPLPGVPRHHLQLGLDWHSRHGWRAGLDAEALSSVPVDDTDSERSSGYGLLGVRLDHTWRTGTMALTVFARLDNLLDRQYVGAVVVNQAQGRFYEAGPGRRVFVGVRLRHGGVD